MLHKSQCIFLSRAAFYFILTVIICYFYLISLIQEPFDRSDRL
ncbi:hypothetical protein HMPREF0372_02013 [Flavonifractor plautii ATCC 29863]|uniref:Uncharacterized protein n=1 Tax=Flavonifractor plautii ATCC 29863 TaxID=411475 RepID=G9YR70_FLAPL|nr:hypothetical protein HMPREF0372_02013 [Flavonifractor plautii ATCC 29863]